MDERNARNFSDRGGPPRRGRRQGLPLARTAATKPTWARPRGLPVDPAQSYASRGHRRRSASGRSVAALSAGAPRPGAPGRQSGRRSTRRASTRARIVEPTRPDRNGPRASTSPLKPTIRPLYFLSLLSTSPSPLPLSCIKWPYDTIREVHMRRYLLRHCALEMFSSDGRNHFLIFHQSERDKIFQK